MSIFVIGLNINAPDIFCIIYESFIVYFPSSFNLKAIISGFECELSNGTVQDGATLEQDPEWSSYHPYYDLD